MMDIFELLNADSAKLRAVAVENCGDRPELELAAWVDMGQAFQRIASAISFNLPENQTPVFENAADIIRRVMLKYCKHLGLWPLVHGQRDGEGQFKCFVPLASAYNGRGLFLNPTINFYITLLIGTVRDATSQTIMTCDYCGSLARRGRCDQRFCKAECRLAEYEKNEWQSRREATEAAVAATV